MESVRVNEVVNMINTFILSKSLGHDNFRGVAYFFRVGFTVLAPPSCNFIDNAF